MKRILFMVGLMGLAASGAFVPAPYGDVTLKGPVGVRLETMLKNHVFATDTVEKGPFTLALRIPAWSKHTSIRINGQRVENVQAGTYYELGRVWTVGARGASCRYVRRRRMSGWLSRRRCR